MVVPKRRSAAREVVEPREIDKVRKEIAKKYGPDVLASGKSKYQPQRIPTGIFLLDYCLLGGIPVSRGTMLLGKKHGGKTMTALKIVASMQRLFPDKVVAFVDIESTFDAIWAAKLGVDVEALLVVEPESGEAAADIIDALMRTLEVGMVVVDSVAALAPMKEIESSSEDAHVGLQARLMGALLRKTTAGMIAERHRGHMVTPVYINQFRSKIGGFQKFGEPLSVPGGHALGFANSVEITIKNSEKAGKDANGVEVMAFNEHAFSVGKNKCNGGPRAGEFTLYRADGVEEGLSEGDIDNSPTMLQLSKKFDAFTGAGSAWKLAFWDEEHKFRGAADTLAALRSDLELQEKFGDYLIWRNAQTLRMPDYMLRRFTDKYGL